MSASADLPSKDPTASRVSKQDITLSIMFQELSQTHIYQNEVIMTSNNRKTTETRT